MMKIKQCKQKDIDLMIIDDAEWKKNKGEMKIRIGTWLC